MDIDFIEVQYRQDVLKVMEICGVDMNQAYILYTESGYNFEAAINRKFNPVSNVPDIPPQVVHDPYIEEGPHGQMGQISHDPNSLYDEEDVEYAQYKDFRNRGKPFDKKYPIRAKQGIIKSFIPKFFKGQEDHPFKRNLQTYLDRTANLKCDNGNLSQSFHWGWKERFPLAVIILDFSQQQKTAIKRFFSDDLLIQKLISEQFKAYGLNAKEYDIQNELKPFFNLQRDANHMVICRVNHLDEIIIIQRISLINSPDQIRKHLKKAKSQCIQSELEESHIIKQFVEEFKGNYYQRPKTIKESIKARENKKIRKQQEEEFFKACQPKNVPKEEEKSEPSRQNQPIPPQNIQKKQVIPENKPTPEPVQSSQKILKGRKDQLSFMKKYTQGITFKIRFPSGSHIMLTVGSQEKIQYLFDFIACQPDELGFTNELNRNFDISIGFGGSQTLKGKQQKQIKQIFEESEVLIVREL